jgi:hypothetical protein
MNSDLPLLFLSFVTIASLIISLVFVVGIVWRVEMELDLSYKFQAAAVSLLIIAEILDLFPMSRLDVGWSYVLPILKLLIAGNLLLGLFFMRDLIRRLDGEKQSRISSRSAP